MAFVQMQCVGASHAQVLASLHAQCFAAQEHWNTAAMASLMGSAGVCAGLVLADGQPAGFVMLRCVAGEAEILTLCVLPEHRRQGLAAQLVAWSLARARAQKAEMVFLEVSVGNSAAQKLYAQARFEPKGQRRAYYPDGSDALVLGRTSEGAA
ncbi:GNAT family N-acetyltransferase [Acetobacter lambici]|uniref:GNAT family N-acetyltransferase n=1 Tax=Acetobacter lambici TaxID=1332824 RepID=A0ABT1EYC3_9PROT|nr:GNAT family N-acetyltransferase [Acetobacter lambici]MCP1241863.1 GNAT family N-acetyltransferase [Acetobacter lambici]MCP1257940.1 GNAT family N-acetyltransferase [Acetobacter lambici]